MKHIIFLITVLVINFSAISQTQNFLWAKQMEGSDLKIGHCIDLDSTRNIYTVGKFQGTTDFDPGPGTSTLTAIGDDMYVTKLDSNGNFLWVKSFGDMYYGLPSAVVDKAGNIYITSSFRDTIDFDPGPGTYTVAASYLNIKSFVLKLDHDGNFLWVRNLDATSTGITVDKNGNSYTSGWFMGTTDFDTGAGINNVTSTTTNNSDMFVLKLDNSGNYVWAKTTGGTDAEIPNGITLDPYDNVLITGSYLGIADFDPSPATYTVNGGSLHNIFALKLDNSGNFIWAKTMIGTGGKAGQVIKSDAVGNIYISGNYNGNVDFDPGVPVFSITAVGNSDFFIEKLDASGNFLWAKSIGGVVAANVLRGMSLDKFGSVYCVGEFNQTSDYDPGPATYNLVPFNGSQNMFISKLDNNGNFVWAKKTGMSSSESGRSVILDTLGNVFITGLFTGVCDFDPGAGSALLYSVSGQGDAFVLKLGPCFTPVSPTNTTTPANINFCPNSSAILSAASTGTVTWHATPTSTAVLGTGYTYTTPVLAAGTYTYYAQAKTCTVSANRTAIIITANPASTPTITAIGNNTICSGSSATFTLSGGVSYTSSPIATSTITGNVLNVLPPYQMSYFVVGTNSLGCKSASTPFQVVVNTTCTDVWPGDVNSDGLANNLDFLELGINYLQAGPSRTLTGNNWQAYTTNSWTGYTSGGKNLSNSDCNGDGIIDLKDTLAIYNNYGLSHALRTTQTTTVNSQLRIVPDQGSLTAGTWGSSSIYLGDSATQINNITGVAFTIDFDNTLIETNSIWIEYPTSYINTLNQNLHFRKTDFANGALYTATTHTVNSYSNGYGKIAILHYQISSGLTTTQVLNFSITQAKKSMAGYMVVLTSNTASVTAMGASVGLQELIENTVSLSPNPTYGSLTINSKTELQKIEVLSITGQVLISEVPTNVSHTIHLENLSNGIYFVNVYQNDRIVKREKIVLNK